MLQERRVESIGPQVVFKPIRQNRQFRFKVIVTDFATGLVPDLFLGIEIGCSRREFDDHQAGIGGEQFSHRWAAMLLGSIPEHHDLAEREGLQNGLQMNCGGLGAEVLGTGHQFFSSAQVQAAVEAHFLASRIHSRHRCFTLGRPNRHGCGL
jgi:hypothetical protein